MAGSTITEAVKPISHLRRFRFILCSLQQCVADAPGTDRNRNAIDESPVFYHAAAHRADSAHTS